MRRAQLTGQHRPRPVRRSPPTPTPITGWDVCATRCHSASHITHTHNHPRRFHFFSFFSHTPAVQLQIAGDRPAVSGETQAARVWMGSPRRAITERGERTLPHLGGRVRMAHCIAAPIRPSSQTWPAALFVRRLPSWRAGGRAERREGQQPGQKQILRSGGFCNASMLRYMLPPPKHR